MLQKKVFLFSNCFQLFESPSHFLDSRTEPVVSTSSKAASTTVSAAASVSASVPAASKPAVVVSKAEVSTDVAASVVAPAAVAVAGEHGHVKFGQPANADSDVTAPATKPAKKSALKASVSISTSEAVAEPAAAVATAPVEALDNDDGGLHVWHSDLGQHSLFSNLGVKLLELWTHLLESGKVSRHCFVCHFPDSVHFVSFDVPRSGRFVRSNVPERQWFGVAASSSAV